MFDERWTRRTVLLSGAALGAVSAAAIGAERAITAKRSVTSAMSAAKSPFVIGCTGQGVTSLRFRDDTYDTDYIRAGAALGEVVAQVRRGVIGWRTLRTGTAPVQSVGAGELRLETHDSDAVLASLLSLEGDVLRWRILLRNDGADMLDVGDLCLPMPMNTEFAAGQPVSAAVLKHSFVSGHGSHVFWMRGNSAGPYLMLLPEPGSALEYWNVRNDIGDGRGTWCAYVHAVASAAGTAAHGTHWRQPTSMARLAPGEERHYDFTFRWVADYDAARDAIVSAGLVDVEVTPGMTVPSDLHVDIALSSTIPVTSIAAEFPDDTDIRRLPDRGGRRLWRVRFARLGENRLTLRQPNDRITYLEFFATEPVETMMKKRAAFIVRRQHRDAAKWYDGLFGEWNMATQTLLGPDNYDRIKGWRIYEVTCDDPGLSKPAYLATKNAEHPVAAEVAALDRYIDRFVWGGLQRTTGETHPYGIYGIPDWKQNRDSKDPGPKGRMHIWRPYDYPHIFAMYFAMYRIAQDHKVPTRLSAAAYLDRACGTALAMFTVPMRVTGWSAYNTGFYNECVLPELIAALRAVGKPREAATLQAHWARKVRAFVDPEADLFGSEYPFDSTGFESTQALARSALDAPAAMEVSAAAARDFADRQIAANLFCRGWLEPAYYYLGSDYRGSAGDAYTLTYMAQMGGWGLLDYALNDARDPHPLLRLGYASQLSAWALLNSGPAATNHGYWYPGEGNDGAAGGGFEPAPEGTTWLGQPHQRGSWYYSCEIDLGFCGAVRAAATIVADDPVFGRICHGGTIEGAGTLRISPRDGVRRRLHLRLNGLHADVKLLDARFHADAPIVVAPYRRSISFVPERFSSAGSTVKIETRYDGGARRTRVVEMKNHAINIVLDA